MPHSLTPPLSRDNLHTMQDHTEHNAAVEAARQADLASRKGMSRGAKKRAKKAAAKKGKK